MRQRIREHMDALLGSDAVLAVPSAPGPAPILNTPQAELHDYRKSMLALTSIAGLAGLPQVCVHFPRAFQHLLTRHQNCAIVHKTLGHQPIKVTCHA